LIYFRKGKLPRIHRLLAKAEELENLVNAEATDIDEVLHMINGIQIQSSNGRRHSDQSKYDKKYF